MKEEPHPMRLLPDDTLAGVLRRLAPRDLAASRCVLKAWRDIVDDRRLLLPHEVGGIFIKFHSTSFWELFSRPSTGPTVSGRLDCVPNGTKDECMPPRLDHCNGLFLFEGDYVFNPATRRCARLPSRPPPLMTMEHFYDDPYLVYDPAVSPHDEVFLMPRIRYKREPTSFQYCSVRDALDPAIEKSEWPPSPCILRVFSSKTGKWEQRSYLREGQNAGTIADVRFDCLFFEKRYAVCWREELYMHCEADFIMRISLSNNRFQVIKPPTGSQVSLFQGLYLGQSKSGIQCASVDNSGYPCRLRIWILQEFRGQMGWVLKHQADIGPMLPRHDYNQPINGPWMLQDINHYERHHRYEGKKEKIAVPEKFEWDSDNDNVLETGDRVHDYSKHITFLGFHPYKEVVFLAIIKKWASLSFERPKGSTLGQCIPKRWCLWSISIHK